MEKLKNFVKSNRIVYGVYFFVMSAMISILKLFVRPDNKLILFVSYGGRRYADSPRVMYETMLKDPRFQDYKLVWAFTDPEKHAVAEKIKIDTFKYFKIALKARCWITNVMVERALNFKGKNTYYFFTTHGVLPKLDGLDAKGNFKSLAKAQYDCCIVSSEAEKSYADRIFAIDKSIVETVGFPKNDILVSHSEEYRNAIRNKLGIPPEKKAILYAPTFRESNVFFEQFDLNIEQWKKELGNEYVLLYRAHPVVTSSKKQEDAFFIDVTKYEVVEDLMIASDMLISDYSGIVFDYSIMHKPIVLWTYDYDEYQAKRGLYFDVREYLDYEEDENKLIHRIKNINEKENLERVIAFQQKYSTVAGGATDRCLDIIYKNIN